MDIEFSEAADINVEVQALNLEGIKQNLLDYVQDQAKIDIADSVDKADKSAQSAETYAAEAAASATAASACAEQTSENLGLYYKKNETDTLLNGKADVATTLSGYGITDGANTALSNLNSDGQMIVDSQNGTISNCVLEIPQNIKASIASNVVTLASGSVITLTGSTYTTYTLTAAQTYTISSSLADGKYYLFTNSAGVIQAPIAMTDVVSATSLPASGTYCYLTTDKTIYKYENSEWNATTLAYPLGIIEMSGGVASYAKNSNGDDMIFNGAGFIGNANYFLPGVSVLVANGTDNDGTLKSIKHTNNSLLIRNMQGASTCYIVFQNGNGINADTPTHFFFQDEEPEITARYEYWWCEKNNKWYGHSNTQTQWYEKDMIIYGTFVKASGYYTDFVIKQPVRTATVEMLNSALGDIETLLATV